MEEGYLPHQRSLDTQAELEEDDDSVTLGSRGQWSSYISRMPVRGEHFERRSIACNLVLFLKSRSISSSMWIGTDLPSVNQGGLYEVVSEDVVDYHVGQIVLHPQFGRGKITKISRAGHGVYVTVGLVELVSQNDLIHH